MIKPDFEIKFRPFNAAVVFKMQVTITHQSDQVLRFTIRGGAKQIKMEKLLLRKRYPWKVTATNFKLDGNAKDHAMNIARIQDEIDLYLKEQSKINN